MENNQNHPQQPDNGKRPKGSIWLTLIITVAIVLLISSIYNAVSNSQYTLKTYSHFAEARENGQLLKVIIHTDRVIYTTKEEAGKHAFDRTAFYTGLPFGDVLAMADELVAEGVEVDNQIVEDNSWIISILSYVLMFAFIFIMMRMITPAMWLLNRYHHPFYVIYTNDPGEIVYEDEYQVAVKVPDEMDVVDYHHGWVEPDGTIHEG